MLIFAVRHGQTDWNIAQRFQGRTDVPLNSAGLAQANALGISLARFHPGRVVASPLIRAQVTGQAVAFAAGLSTVDTDERLVERCMGSCEGAYISERPNYFSIWDADDGTMEPLADVRARMVAALRGLAGGGGPTVTVSHGAALNALLTEVSGGIVGTGITRLVNCCINVIGLDESDGGLVLLAYNLPPEGLSEWVVRQGVDALAPDATNAERLAALKTPIVPPECAYVRKDADRSVDGFAHIHGDRAPVQHGH